MSDQEPEPSADATTADDTTLALLHDLTEGKLTAQSGILDANNTVNYWG